MRVSYAQRWRLRQMGRSMSRSDPHLTAMLMIFARLTAGEAIASIEQTGFRHTRAWRNLAGMKEAAWLLLSYGRRLARWTAAAIARPWRGREQSWLGLGPGHDQSRADERSW